jgi:RND family efflux transporter MFP subunit
MANRRLIALATLAALGSGVLALALARPHADSTDTPPLAVRAVTIAATGPGAPGGPRFAATLHYDRETDLAFRVPGRITGLSLQPGDRIAPGALVAAIEPDAFAAAEAMHAAGAARDQRDAARIASLVGDGATSPAAADAARDAARASAAGLAGARYDLASTRLRAPFAALVLSRSAERSQTIAAGQPVVRVADRASPLLAIADVPADLAAHLAQGGTAQVWPTGAAAPVGAHIWRIAGSADAHSGLVAVKVRLDAPLGLASGSPAAVGFAVATAHETRQRLPAEALIDANTDSATVWLIDTGGHARRHSVQFFGFDDRDALVGGLPAGARVITAGAGFVGEGQIVAVIGA